MGIRHLVHSWRTTAGLLAVLLAAGLATAAAAAHQSLEHYLQFSAKSVFHEDMLDTFLDIGFNGARALAERQAMDANADGVIDSNESAGYLARLQSGLSNLLRMRLDGAVLALVPLYEAEVDFQEERLVGEHPFNLRMSFFARAPRLPRAPRQLVADIAFFAETPALLTWDITREAEGGTALLAQFQEAYTVDEKGPKPRLAAVPLHDSAPAPPLREKDPPADATVEKTGAYADRMQRERDKLRESQKEDEKAKAEKQDAKTGGGKQRVPLIPRGKS